MTLIKTLIAAAAVVATVTTGFASAGSPSRFDLLGPHVRASCDGTELEGEPEGTFGHVTFSSPGNGLISAHVSLKGAEPNLPHLVALTNGGEGCLKADGAIVTNEQGNGSIRITEEAVGDYAWVLVWGPYPGEREYSAAVYRH